MIFLKLVGIAVILVLSLKIVMSEGMLLGKLGEYLDKREDENKFFKMLICPYCMGTLQVIVAHFFAIGLDIIPAEWNWKLLIRYPLIVGATSIIAGNFWNLYETINRIKEKNEMEAAFFHSQFENSNNN